MLKIPLVGAGLSQAVASPRPWQTAGNALGAVLAFACAAAVTYWTLQWSAHPVAVPAQARLAGAPSVDALAAAAPRLFGASAPLSAPEKSRFELLGVIGGGRQAGSALLRVDGGAVRAFPVGAMVAPEVRLESTAFGQAVLLQGDTHLVLHTPRSAPVPSSDAAGVSGPMGTVQAVPLLSGSGPKGMAGSEFAQPEP